MVVGNPRPVSVFLYEITPGIISSLEVTIVNQLEIIFLKISNAHKMKKRNFWSCSSLEKIARCLTDLSIIYTISLWSPNPRIHETKYNNSSRTFIVAD
jgi:hypothetical protein